MAAVADIPDLGVVGRVVRSLEAHGLVAAIGGSGLLASLGLVGAVRDWDVTTDGLPELVEAALDDCGYVFAKVPAGEGAFATVAHYVVAGGDHEVDVIVGFAVLDGDDRVELPTRVTGTWNGLPIADPEVWETAYRLLGRPGRA
jgi:hypothetical protein